MSQSDGVRENVQVAREKWVAVTREKRNDASKANAFLKWSMVTESENV